MKGLNFCDTRDNTAGAFDQLTRLFSLHKLITWSCVLMTFSFLSVSEDNIDDKSCKWFWQYAGHS